ncbi:MAG TPA: hypothetical protein VFT82_02380 [Candidatus Paceibacterota bacterium]|nr:hypothetical protein [Candidatus Paceibacterota bacterium]
MNTQKPGTEGFSVHFRKLSSAAESSRRAAQEKIEANVKARVARLGLIRDHIRAGGKITPAQKRRLSLPEQAYVEAVELGNDPDLRATIQEIESLLVGGATATIRGVKNLWEKLNGKH